jgi:hypothetical protein
VSRREEVDVTSPDVAPIGTAAECAYREEILTRIRRVSSTELARCILAVDAVACRDNLRYSARKSGTRSSFVPDDRD